MPGSSLTLFGTPSLHPAHGGADTSPLGAKPETRAAEATADEAWFRTLTGELFS